MSHSSETSKIYMRKLQKVKYLIEELKLLGWFRASYRIFYEFKNRSKINMILSPIRQNFTYIPKKNFISLPEWYKAPLDFFSPKIQSHNEYTRLFSKVGRETLLKKAQKTLTGQVFCFGNWWADFGQPFNWHLNPDNDKIWPQDEHHSCILPQIKNFGDIKYTWEASRFPHFFLFIRAYYLTKETKWYEAFFQQIASWERQNKYCAGANWSSGQEVAIRALVWIWGLFSFREENRVSQENFELLQRQIYLHGCYLHKNINFARYAVYNDHLIAEALGLYAIGLLFPWFDKAKKWKKLGKHILEVDCCRQFFADGGYSKNSHNYQRIAMHYYLWACRLGEVNNDRFSDAVYQHLANSCKLLQSFLCEDGRLPNWGTNDGALFCPWTECDYSDFRPVISALHYLCHGTQLFGEGPWQEELFWFFDLKAIKAHNDHLENKSKSFPIAGLHILRYDSKNFATFRCGSIIERFAQADQNHVDIWWRGLNIAVDGGTYSYNTQTQYNRYFMSTRSHNTIIVDHQNQMYHHRPYKWLYWTKANIIDFDIDKKIISGQHFGYQKMLGDVVHKRKLSLPEIGYIVVTDNLVKGQKIHHYCLHWLLDLFPYVVEKKTKNSFLLRLTTSQGNYFLFVFNKDGFDANICVGISDGQEPCGWHSRYYGKKEKAISLSFYTSKANTNFISIFGENIEKIQNHFASISEEVV